MVPVTRWGLLMNRTSSRASPHVGSLIRLPRIWQTGEWPTPWTQSLVITLSKKGNLQQCQNYRTISLISHPSKVMLKKIILSYILNRTDSSLGFRFNLFDETDSGRTTLLIYVHLSVPKCLTYFRQPIACSVTGVYSILLGQSSPDVILRG